MKKALLKDSIKEIKNTYKRFISILLMAFLGVGFFAGMRAASPDMIDTIDQYYKESQVYDVQVMSTLGLTKQDREAIEKLENIEKVIGTYEIDGKIEIEEKEVIAKIMCLEEINRPVLLQGRLPEKQEECVVEESFLKRNNKVIGDTIEIEIEDIKDYLKQNKLTIVGTVKSPFYISRDRGTSNLGAGKIDYYMYIAKENIKASEIYTNGYIQVKDANRYKTTSNSYKKQIQKVKEEIEEIKEERQQARHSELVKIATDKVTEAEATFQMEKQKAEEELEKAKREIQDGKIKLNEAENQIRQKEQEANTQLKKASGQIKAAKQTIIEKEKQLVNKEQEAEQQFKELEEQKQELQIQINTISATLENVKIQYQQIKDNPEIPQEQKQVFIAQIEKLETTIHTLQAGIQQIEQGITQGKQEIENGKIQIQAAKVELNKQEKQYETKKNETEGQLQNAKLEIEKSKKELETGEEELEKNQKDVKQKMEEAEEKLIDAKEEITKIENPKWYILDREGNSGYNSFVQDTGSIENIARVFPIVFFLVATLISLTSMTRMVEEQRTQIGTLKALGYNKWQIASKYIIYASLACFIGGILGMSMGFALLPSIVWKMYQMMYDIADKIHLSFNIAVGGIGLILISICIIGATIYSVLKEVTHEPATLMRPKAPKIGKRVFLEKIPFIWKHFSFSRKVTIRNIFRYKKRFLMTIIGIAGCTALILVGFGIRDSIRCIMPNQFEKVFDYDMQIALKTSTEEEKIQEIVKKIQEKEVVEKVIETHIISSTAKNQESEEEIQIVVPKEQKELEGIINLVDIKTHQKIELKEKEVCLTDKVAELLKVKIGDNIVLTNKEGKEIEVKISNIVENYISHYIYMSKNTYENLYQDNYHTNVLFIKNAEIEQEKEQQLASELLTQNQVATITRISTSMRMLDDTMKSLNYVVIILIVSAGLLAFVVLYNLANVNISERIRELATIKVLGFYDKEVYSYVTRETVILTGIGIILGLIGGYFLNYFIIRNM